MGCVPASVMECRHSIACRQAGFRAATCVGCPLTHTCAGAMPDCHHAFPLGAFNVSGIAAVVAKYHESGGWLWVVQLGRAGAGWLHRACEGDPAAAALQ